MQIFDLKPAVSAELTHAFFAFVRDRDFPCAGAKAALAADSLRVVTARNLTSGWDDLTIHQQLCAFGEAVRAGEQNFQSLAVLFDGPEDLDEAAFEAVFWERLQSLRDKDRWLSYRHDSRVDPDPQSAAFAFSIGGEAFFVVGMHPKSSRASRRTPMPVMVFNPFSQFERLREEGRYERMSEVIKQRDTDLCGSPNLMLSDHGNGPTARQFSGRAVDDDWKCPLRTERPVTPALTAGRPQQKTSRKQEPPR